MGGTMTQANDVDPLETREWLDSLQAVLQHDGAARASYLLDQLTNEAHRGIRCPFCADDTLRQYDFSGARRVREMGSRYRAPDSFNHSLERRRDYSAC